MKKYSLIGLLFCAFGHIAIAQKDFRNSRVEIGIDLLPTLKKNTLGIPYFVDGLMFPKYAKEPIKSIILLGKYKFSTQTAQQWAMRGQFGYNQYNQKRDNIFTFSDNTDAYDDINLVYTGLGIERRKYLGKNVLVYGAIDAIYWKSQLRTIYKKNEEFNAEFYDYSKTWEANAVLGVQYNVNRRIGFSVETNLAFYDNKAEGVYVRGVSGGLGFGYQTAQGMQFNTLSKLSFVYVLY